MDKVVNVAWPEILVFNGFLAAKRAAQEAPICGGGGGGVLTQVEIHLSPFKCQLFHSFIVHILCIYVL